MPSTSVQIVDSIGAIPAPRWDALVGERPLLSHAFLHALHDTGCASPQTGWAPCFVTAWKGDELTGAMPLYRKAHSYGEYVFDWSWADAYRRHGRRYYPKLVAAVPFTPAAGPRLIARDASTRKILLDTALSLLAEGGFSSLHILFPDELEVEECVRAGMVRRDSIQFHWANPGYRDFADFLSTMNHAKRKKILQERRKVADAGVEFTRMTGRDIEASDWAFFYRCYSKTYREHHSTPYLSPEFFQRIGATLADNVLLVVGRSDGKPVCAALDIHGGGTLWGRYWGTTAHISGLHFETCYYQAIEFCIERHIGLFEGGAQGSHKLARGFLPVTTRSLHAVSDPDFARAIDAFVHEERGDVARTVNELERASPFKEPAFDRTGPGSSAATPIHD
jgi:predicted N-acyltransferase